MRELHGLSKHPLHKRWVDMRQRCTNPKRSDYADYGGRGITVCEEWRNSFTAFYTWAMSHGYKEGLTIERNDVNGNYEPANCTWATPAEQANNRRNSPKLSGFGETKTLKAWVADHRCVVGYRTLNTRFRRGWDIELALTKPIGGPYRGK